ncbi:MAG: uroporphyrinogen-III C-methyltransferase [Planctomycetaceae bacterium]|nr:uroporphyrinogen-III C-methyltransferase [Planctomycetaceae bacterium]
MTRTGDVVTQSAKDNLPDSNQQAAGSVWLVGAGPGDPGLITVRGIEVLAQADLVLYDGLVNPLLLRHTKAVCERTARARRDGSAIVPQEEINRRLVEEARAGRKVVRLKGGDPYIFGRGSEEAAALEAAGIPFEVVPGITAAAGAGEYAGFSYTHRDISSAVAFVTGHEDPTRSPGRLDYAALARFPGTLVFYMGLSRLKEICSQLICHGMASATPAAVVCQATLPSQKVLDGTLASLPDKAEESGLRPPSLIVVGECVTQREHLTWFEKLPLFGQSIGITRPEEQADTVADQIVRMGGEPVMMPMIEIQPVDNAQSSVIRAALQRLSEFDWIIWTSVNGVDEFFRHLNAAGLDSRALGRSRLAVIGSSTADRLRNYGLIADLVPDQFRAEALADGLAPHVNGRKVLWARASRGRDVLPDRLARAGAHVEQLVVYQNRDCDTLNADVLHRIQAGTLHWVGLSSPSIARQFSVLLTNAGIDVATMSTKVATISPVTSEAARAAGLVVHAEAKKYTWPGLLQAMCFSK